MTELNQPLSDAELDRLDRFLLERIDEEAETEDQDEGVIDLSTLDGMFTALVSSPVMIPPSQWLPAVWGDFEPVWDEMEDFQEIFSLLVRHMNAIVGILTNEPEAFEPLFLGREAEGKSWLIVDEWCEGYVRGVSLAGAAWAAGGEEVKMLLAPILAFTEQTDWAGHEHEGEDLKRIQQTIAPNARALHAYWLSRRQAPASAFQPLRHSEPRIGRNDPCPCGSGKKYKRCCLQ